MVRRVGLLAVLALAGSLIAADTAWARHRGGCGGGCGRGHRHRGHACGGGCGGGGCGGCATACGGYVDGCGGMVYGGGMPYVDGGMYGGGTGGTLPPAIKGKGKKGMKKGAEGEEEEIPISTQGSLVVTLPEGATFVVDGQVIPTAPGTQVFYTPDLQPGQDYFYTVQAQTVQDGQVVQVTRRVTVRAGEQSQVNFDVPTDAVVTD